MYGLQTFQIIYTNTEVLMTLPDNSLWSYFQIPIYAIHVWEQQRTVKHAHLRSLTGAAAVHTHSIHVTRGRSRRKTTSGLIEWLKSHKLHSAKAPILMSQLV